MILPPAPHRWPTRENTIAQRKATEKKGLPRWRNQSCLPDIVPRESGARGQPPRQNKNSRQQLNVLYKKYVQKICFPPKRSTDSPSFRQPSSPIAEREPRYCVAAAHQTRWDKDSQARLFDSPPQTGIYIYIYATTWPVGKRTTFTKTCLQASV